MKKRMIDGEVNHSDGSAQIITVIGVEPLQAEERRFLRLNKMYQVDDVITHHDGTKGTVVEIGEVNVIVQIKTGWIQRWNRRWVKEDELYMPIPDPFPESDQGIKPYSRFDFDSLKRLTKNRRRE